jgi:hypothetical protein
MKHDPKHCSNCERGVPHIGERCPKCHKNAPRLDGIPCALCSPYCGTLTDPKTGITHAYKTGCTPTTDLAGLKLKHFNVGDVPVNCLECIATLEKPRREPDGQVVIYEYA